MFELNFNFNDVQKFNDVDVRTYLIFHYILNDCLVITE